MSADARKLSTSSSNYGARSERFLRPRAGFRGTSRPFGQTEFADFFEASWDPCLRAVVAVVGSPQLAEDQVAEAFARAFASWRKVGRHPAPRAWVVRTGRHPAGPEASSAPSSAPSARLAAWTVTRQADGDITVTVNELRDPAGLQRTLRADGVPASVTLPANAVKGCRVCSAESRRQAGARSGLTARALRRRRSCQGTTAAWAASG